MPTAARCDVCAEPYAWGNDRWHKTTWRKVHAVRSVYALGFNVIHSDADSTWWSDPLPWFTTNVRAGAGVGRQHAAWLGAGAQCAGSPSASHAGARGRPHPCSAGFNQGPHPRWRRAQVIEKPQHLVLTTDSLDTKNDAWDKGLEVSTTPFFNINTGEATERSAGAGCHARGRSSAGRGAAHAHGSCVLWGLGARGVSSGVSGREVLTHGRRACGVE